jgi:hypothetical protein
MGWRIFEFRFWIFEWEPTAGKGNFKFEISGISDFKGRREGKRLKPLMFQLVAGAPR